MKTPPLLFLARALPLLLCLALTPLAAYSQATPNPPGQISYQGFLTDANGIPLGTNAPANYDVVFRIYQGPTGGSALWGEIQTVTVDRGYFSVLLGQGASEGDPWTNNLTTVFTGATASDRYIGITVNGITSPNTEVAPRLRLLASPYALLAANANALVSSSGQELITSGANGFVGINKTNASPASALDVSGTVSATSFAGSGVGLTNLNAGNLTAGTLADARLSANVPLLNANQFFTGTPTFANGFAVANGVPVSGNMTFSGNPTFNNGFAVANGATVSGNMAFTGKPTFDNGFASANDATVSGNMTLSGALTAQQISGTILEANGPLPGQSLILAVGFGGDMAIQAGIAPTFRALDLNAFGGNVGIGISNPANRLHVVGPNNLQLRLQESTTSHFWDLYTETTGNFIFLCQGLAPEAWIEASSGAYKTSSDQRLKKDVEPLGPVLERALQLRPVSYRMKTVPESAPKALGFIAQEVEPLFPEVVSEANGMKGLAYSELVPVAIGAVQELNQKVESQDKQIRDLKGEVERLRGLVEVLARSQTAPAPAASAR